MNTMNLSNFLEKLLQQPEHIQFTDTMEVIESNYTYTPTLFKNGETSNAARENEGSCKIFAFAKLNKLDPASTLACFGDYYRVDVLENPEGTDHQNIRQFMKHGWSGIEFKNDALKIK